jgi:abortive infection alpha-like protein
MSLDLMLIGGGALLGEFSRRVAGKLRDGVGEGITSFAKHRLGNLAEIFRRAEIQVRDAGEEAKEIRPRLLIPIVDKASLEDDESMRERWAALLARASIAASDEEIPPLYVDILSQLTPRAAVALEVIEHTRPTPLQQSRIGSGDAISLDTLVAEMEDRLGDASPGHVQDTAVVVDMLVRQQLATRDAPLLRTDLSVRAPTGTDYQYAPVEVRITELGRRFLAACKPLDKGHPGTAA